MQIIMNRSAVFLEIIIEYEKQLSRRKILQFLKWMFDK